MIPSRLVSMFPLLIPAVSMAAGILCVLAGIPWEIAILWWVVGVVLIIWYRSARKVLSRAIKSGWMPVAATVCISFGCGMALEAYHSPDSVDFEYDNLPPMVVAKVESVQHMTYGDRMIVCLESMTDAEGNVKRNLHNIKAIITTSDYLLSPYDRFTFINGLKRIEDNPNYQDRGYKRYYELQGTIWRQTIKAGEAKILSPAHSFGAWCNAIHDRLFIAVEGSHLQRSTAAFLNTMLLGDDDLLTTDTRELFADAGISHILAVSGLHTGIIAALILMLTAPMSLLGWRRFRYIAVILLTWVYVMLSGCHLSAVRAAIMVTVVMGGLALERRRSSFNALCLALIIILFFSPRALLNPGVQLSFVCVGSLLCFGSYCTRITHTLPRKVQILCSTALASVVAVFGSWALTAYYFHNFPLLFLPVNVVVLPLLPIYLIVALLHMALLLCGIEVSLLTVTLDYGYHALEWVCTSIAGGSVLTLWLHAATPVLWLIGLAVLAYALHSGGKRPVIVASSLLVAAVASAVILPGNRPKDGVIVQRSSQSVVLAEYVGGIENVSEYSVGSPQAVYLGGRRVCITGNEKGIQRHFTDSCDLLVITTGNRSLGELQTFFRPRAIALHPALRSSIAERLKSEARNSGVVIHDIAADGPVLMLND